MIRCLCVFASELSFTHRPGGYNAIMMMTHLRVIIVLADMTQYAKDTLACHHRASRFDAVC